MSKRCKCKELFEKKFNEIVQKNCELEIKEFYKRTPTLTSGKPSTRITAWDYKNRTLALRHFQDTVEGEVEATRNYEAFHNLTKKKNHYCTIPNKGKVIDKKKHVENHFFKQLDNRIAPDLVRLHFEGGNALQLEENKEEEEPNGPQEENHGPRGHGADEVTRLLGKLEDLQLEQNKEQEKLKEQQEEIQTLRGDLKRATDEVTCLLGNLVELQLEQNEEQVKLKEQQEENQSLRGDLQDATDEVAHLRDRLEDLKNEVYELYDSRTGKQLWPLDDGPFIFDFPTVPPKEGNSSREGSGSDGASSDDGDTGDTLKRDREDNEHNEQGNAAKKLKVIWCLENIVTKKVGHSEPAESTTTSSQNKKWKLGTQNSATTEEMFSEFYDEE